MKKIFNKFKEKVNTPKEESLPTYEETYRRRIEQVYAPRRVIPNDQDRCEVVDLLANCKLTDETASSDDYAEIQEMGIWHSTPLPGRHKSKISLTWVLKESLEKDIVKNKDVKYQRHINRHENERQRKLYRPVPAPKEDRVVGRNAYYNNYTFKNNYDHSHDTYSDNSFGTSEYGRRRHRHKHRRKKSRHSAHSGRYGYDIKDVDEFLSGASIDRPGNIPVVVAYPSILYQTHGDVQQEMELPLGTVVNAVFKNKQWLYVQTPHAHEGYILYSACLPLGILPNKSSSPQKKTPCWESSTDIYPRPCGNLTDTEKEQLRGRTKSECRYRGSNTQKRAKNTKSLCGEEEFDKLYLKSKSISNLSKYEEEIRTRKQIPNYKERKRGNAKNISRHVLLVINKDYVGDFLNNTISVNQGDVVILIQSDSLETDVDSEWFYIRKNDGKQGFIPADIAGHGYI